jgi:hypothetical protein
VARRHARLAGGRRRRLRVTGCGGRVAGSRRASRLARLARRCGGGGHGRRERGHEVGRRRRDRPGNVTERGRPCRGAQDVSERELPDRTDAETAEDHEREPDEEEQSRRAPDPAHPLQAPAARVLEDAARRYARCRVRAGEGHSL